MRSFCAKCSMPLVRPFETSFGVTRNRRILLAEVQSEGLTGWGECTAGEHPYFLGGVDRHGLGGDYCRSWGRCWRREPPEHGGECPRIFQQVRGQPHGEGGAGECHLGSGGAARGDFAVAADWAACGRRFRAEFRWGFRRRFRSCWRLSRRNWRRGISASS